jgi:serine/threonine-protein kinase RsbW
MAENTIGDTHQVERELDSRLESADVAESLAIAAAREAGFSEEEQHRLGMAVRESVINAVVHGNRYNNRKKVHLGIAGGRDRLTVTVRDEGEGFELESLPNPVAQENILQQSGRGIFLIRAFVDEFEVRRVAPRGTEVKLVKYAGRRETTVR